MAFPSSADAEAFVNDPEYAPFMTARKAGSESQFTMIDDTDVAGTIPYLPQGLNQALPASAASSGRGTDQSDLKPRNGEPHEHFRWIRGIALLSILPLEPPPRPRRVLQSAGRRRARRPTTASRTCRSPCAEGYAPIPCASGIDGGAMGIHYVNPAYLKDDAVDIARPEAVMYEPDAPTAN